MEDEKISRPSSVLCLPTNCVSMNDDSLPRVSAVILAGGESRRMGHDKAFIDFGGAPLIERVIERAQPLCAEMIIVTNDTDAYARFGYRIVTDVYPGKGSLGGIFSGLQAAREHYALVVACDMPFLNTGLLNHLISLAPQFDAVIPRGQDPSGRVSRSSRGDRPESGKRSRRADRPIAKETNLHPMHAVYSKNCLPAIQERLLHNDLRAIGFLDLVRVRVIEPDEVDRFDPQHLSFFNANTPEDLESGRALFLKATKDV
jgi:molybdopterin-guanine dinucleotide biosynthesis protein A